MHLDLGQRDFGVATCATCGMMYGKGLPEEERLHDQFHNAHAATFLFPGWVSERVVLRDGARGRLLCIVPGDPKPQQRKVGEVCGRLESVLGLPQGYLLAPRPPYKVFMWVSGGGAGGGGGGGKGRITGVLVAQLQERARWEMLAPTSTARRRGSSQRQQRTAQSDSVTGTVTGAAAAAAEPAPGMPATAAAVGVEVDFDADAGAADDEDAGGGGEDDRLLTERTDARAADGGAAVGTAAAVSDRGVPGYASVGTTSVRVPGPVREASGGKAAKRPRLHEPTRGSSIAPGGESSFVGAAAAAGAATSPAAAGAAAVGLVGSPAVAPATPAPAGASLRAAPPPHRASGGSDGHGGGGCGGERARVVLGVRGLWVEPGWRRRGVATRLMDAARCCMVPGVAADRTGVAFSACAATAASGDDDGGAAFAAFAVSYLGGSRSEAASSSGGGGRCSNNVLMYDDDEDDVEGDSGGAGGQGGTM